LGRKNRGLLYLLFCLGTRDQRYGEELEDGGFLNKTENRRRKSTGLKEGPERGKWETVNKEMPPDLTPFRWR